jgi:hypothetical protein
MSGKEVAKKSNESQASRDPWDLWLGSPLFSPAFMRWDLSNVDNRDGFLPSIDIHEVSCVGVRFGFCVALLR